MFFDPIFIKSSFYLFLPIIIVILYYPNGGIGQNVSLTSAEQMSLAADNAADAEGPPYPCDNAPDGSSIRACTMLVHWYREVEELIAANKTNFRSMPPTNGLSFRLRSYPPSSAYQIYACHNILCLCRFFNGEPNGTHECLLKNGEVLPAKAIRKEIRMMTEEERKKLFSAFHQLKTGENSTEYTRFVRWHGLNTDDFGAHGGPAFLPWHREYLKRFEIAIRYFEPSVALPYWDSTLDARLPDPTFSILWSDEFYGGMDENGKLTGPFANWTTIEDLPLKRAFRKSSKLFDEQMLLDFEDKGTGGFLGFSLANAHETCSLEHNFVTLENRHGEVHSFVGGDMGATPTAPNDPIFWSHHAFVDWIWEDWRQRRQNPEERESDYPPDEFVEKCTGDINGWHKLQSELKPFETNLAPKMTVKEGLGNQYTEKFYEYAQRPTCTQHTGCNSDYLFCDRRDGGHKCASKMREGGPCDVFMDNESENPCYRGQCVEGTCKNDQEENANESAVKHEPAGGELASLKNGTMKKRNCLNSHECCGPWAEKAFCREMPEFMKAWCAASCGFDGCAALAYELKDDCTDRHQFCILWGKNLDGHEECKKNPFWMTENCRKSCGHCGQSRAQKCSNIFPSELED